MNMKKNEKHENSSQKKISRKSKVLGMSFCFVVAMTMIGTYTVRNYQSKMEKEIGKSKEIEKKMEEANKATNATDILIPKSNIEKNENTESELKEDESENLEETNEENQETTSQLANDVSFSTESVLEWPASGSVVLEYSQDHTIYFPTLKEYRYNPALIIGGATGEDIRAGASGIVKDIVEDVRIGNSVTLDLGNGYTAIYGQLKDIPLNVGAYVEKGSILGYLSEPTKYYSVEGTNLYFAMQKDGEYINPMDYME